MWIRPGFQVYWRGPGETQIGLEPRSGMVLNGLSPAEQRLLDRLPHCFDVAEVRLHGRELGLAERAVDALLGRLRQRGYVLDGEPPALHPTLQTDPDEAYWYRAGLAGHERAADRAEATVGIRGLNALALRLGCALVDAGVGMLGITDGTRVRRTDVGAGLYRSSDIGKPRQDAALSVLRSVQPKARVVPRVTKHADVVVLLQSGVADPVAYRDLVRHDVCHLPVVVRDLDVMIGPLVRPGIGPCLRCLDLHRCERGPRWPAVAAQAATKDAPAPETSLAWLGAALTAHQILALIDGRGVETDGSSLHITAWGAVPVRRVWEPHPQCGCTPVALSAEAS